MTASLETLLLPLMKQYLINLIRLSRRFARLHAPSVLCVEERA